MVDPPMAALVPAYNAGTTVGPVVLGLMECWPCLQQDPMVIVVDDGSQDDTVDRARQAGALVVCHGRNRGKGAALRTGLGAAQALGFSAVVTVDADGQHLPREAARLAIHEASLQDLVLGVRDLPGAGAPRANQFSNRISNFFLSRFTSCFLQDTQCGLRRYPVDKTLELDARSDGYGFEAEVLLLAIRAGMGVVQVPVDVLYGQGHRSHFHVARDPAKIIARVLLTLGRNQIARMEGLLRPTLGSP